MGWEPNPTHADHLKGLATAYNKCGWRVLINTATGVGARNQIGKVRRAKKNLEGYSYSILQYASLDKWGNLDWDFSKLHQIAGAIVNDHALDVDDDVKNSKVLVDVSVVRIAENIKEVVGKRSIPHNKKGAVVMKLDVEVMN